MIFVVIQDELRESSVILFPGRMVVEVRQDLSVLKPRLVHKHLLDIFDGFIWVEILLNWLVLIGLNQFHIQLVVEQAKQMVRLKVNHF